MSADVVSAELRQVLRDLKLSGVLDTLPERLELPANPTCPTKSSSPCCSPTRSPAVTAVPPPCAPGPPDSIRP